jgi:4-amino-4-deoxy-L-arabinose transferase-like glycosyltransferase
VLRRRLTYLLVVVALLGGMAFAMVTEAVQQSPTIDEPVYVGTAVVYAQQHSLRYNPEHPPLGKLAMAVGLGFEHAVLDPSYNQNQTLLGRHLLYESGNNPFRLMLAARLPMIVLTLLFGLVVLGFARDLGGPWAGLVALVLYVVDPDVLAHRSLATLDVPAAGLLLTSFWMLWRARSRPGLYLPLAGLAMGAALATRASALPAVPLVLLLTLPVLTLPATKRRWFVRLGAAVGVGLIAVAVVWAVYLAVDPRLRWATPAGVVNPGGLRGLVVDLLPFPAPYRDGVLIQFQFESSSFNGFLLGHAYHGRLWYYLPVALLIKTPLGLLALWLAGAVTMVVRRSLRVAALYVLLPSLVLFLVAMTGARDFGTRYVIFMPMFMTVAASTVLAGLWITPEKRQTQVVDSAPPRTGWGRSGAPAKVLIPTLALTAFVVVSSVRTFPYFLPYSNEAFGGPSKTHLNLHDANVDWGQDLARLGTRLRDRYPGQPIWLVYKGSGVPEYYGIHGQDPLAAPETQVHGLLVVSDSRVALATGELKELIDTSTPIDEVGYSITIYRR